MMRKSSQGTFTIQLIGVILITLIMAALAIDFGHYFAAQNTLQTAADSGSLAAATALYHDIEVDKNTKLANARDAAIELVQKNNPDLTLTNDDVVFGFIDPASKKYDPNNFRTPSTNPDYALTAGYNAVYVRVRQTEDSPNGQLPTFMANMIGISGMNASAESVALLDQTINGVTNGGLRPVYVCEAQFRKAMEDGVPENNVVRIYGDHVEVDGVQSQAGCPAMGSGNWGFADLRNCSPDAVGSSTIRDWFATGFPGTVNVGQCYSSSPGNFISSATNELDKLVSDKTLFPLPLYDSWSGSGSNTSVNVSGFVGFKITGYKANGSQASRYIEGRFYRYACKQGCNTGNAGSGTGTTPGGSVVKLRLAAQ
jgi:Flp pilus assembly protein TadG